jgi:hypothetical protein
MQSDLQYSVFALHPDVFVFVAITVKHAHAPCRYPSFFVADLRSFSAAQAETLYLESRRAYAVVCVLVITGSNYLESEIKSMLERDRVKV